MTIYERIDDQIVQGYEYMYQRQATKCCDAWLDAWEDIKTIIKETDVKSIYDLDKQHRYIKLISNYAQDLSAELHNAGVANPSYHEKRIKYSKELLQYSGSDQRIKENTRRAIAESYSAMGDMETCSQLFEGWLQEDPDWGWGYIGWSDCWYLYKSSGGDYEKAEQVLLKGLSRPEIRDRIDLIARMVELNEQYQRPDKAREYKMLLHKLMSTASETSLYYKPSPTIKPAAPGRNAPCLCGSGQKYKRCCGAQVQKVG